MTLMNMTDIRRALHIAQLTETNVELRHEELAALISVIDSTRSELAYIKAKSEQRKALLMGIDIGDTCPWCGTIQVFRRDDTERKPQHRDDCPLARALED